MTNKPRIIPYQPGHLDFMELRSKDMSKDTVEMRLGPASVGKNGFYIFTVVQDRSPVAVVGFNELFPGVAECWTFMTDEVKKYPVAFCKLMRLTIRSYELKLKVHRIQCSVVSTYETGIRWVESMGFVREGRMKKYGADQADHDLFARVR